VLSNPLDAPNRAVLSIRHVDKAFGGRPVLRDVSLDVHRGEVVALVGENGAGKSTLLGISAGLLAADRGAVIRRGAVGYCPQRPGLRDLLTAREHLALLGRAPGHAPDHGERQGHRLLEELRFPMGQVDGPIARDLSGGNRQKLNLALALLGDPPLLLLDEPYQGFDHGSYVDFWAHTDAWRAAGRAVVVVTHMLAELERVDRVVDLSPGRSSIVGDRAQP
jgi:ABC-type multidrug transport system ATPase subunit